MEENLFTFEKSEQVSNEYISNLNVSKNEQQQNAIETNSVSEAPKQEDDVVDFQTIQNLGELDRESVIQKINTTTDEKERNELTACLMLDDMRLTMLDNQRKAPLRAITEDATRMGSNVESMSDDDVDEELLAGFKAFGLIGDYESIDDVCNTTFNGEGKKEVLKKMREQFYPFLDKSKKIEEFNNLTPENQRKFLEDRIKEKRLKAFNEAGGKVFAVSTSIEQGAIYEKDAEKVKKAREELHRPITEEEIKAEKKDFIMNDYVTRCQNAMKFTQDPQVLSLGIKIALNGEKAEHLFAPQLVNLPKEKQMETLQVAYAFNKEISTWWKITDNLVKGWSSAMGLPEKISEFITTDPADFFDFVNKNGGLEKVLNDEKLMSKFFAYNRDGTLVVRSKDDFGFKHYGFNPISNLFTGLGGSLYYTDKKEDIPNMAKKIYTLGKRISEIKEVQNRIKQVTAPRYYSEGWLEDKVIEGLSFGLEFGQFALLSYVTGGIGGVSKLGASGLNAINKMSNTAKALNKVASVSHKASQSASFLTKATTPYFFARMSNDAIETAQMYGLDKNTAFWGGIVVGVVNGALERLQFKTRQQNTFLVDSIVNKLLSKEKGVVFEVSKNVIMEGLKKRGVTFFEEYLIENTQNVVEEAMLQVEQIIDGKNVRGLDKAFEDIFKQAGEMIIPLLVATNMGSPKGILKGGADILTAQVVKGDELAINSLKEKAILETVLSNAQTSDISAQDVIDYIDAKTPEDKAKILDKYEGKKKAVAQKLFTESDDMWAKHEAQAMLKVEKAITGLSEEDINQGRTIQQAYNELKKEESRNMAFHFIDEFIEAYGGRKDLVVFVDSFDNLPESLKTNENMQRYRDKIEGFFNPNDKKVYIIGDNTMTPKRVLQVLKHEKIHWGVSDINKSKKLRDFFDSVIDAYGGEQIVRAGIYNVKGDAYKKLGKYEMAEEFVSMIAENVKAKHELSEKESKVWKKVKSFVLNMNGVSKNASDEFVSDYIRALWERDVEDSFFGEDEEGVKLSISNEAQRQYNEVKAQWTNPDGTMKEGYMLAPNGKPTNLTERQWIQVRTANFKNWFGDWENDPENASKVVDDNGEPLVVYHGTSAEFTTFKKGRDSGMHFGTLEQATNRSSRNIMPVFLNIRNPKRTHDKMDGQAFEIKKAKKSKFDGLIYRNIFEGEGDSYVAFKPNQIKSATDNIGTFDSANDDIRFSIKAVNTAIDEADIEIDAQLKSEANESDKSLEQAKKKYIQENIGNWSSDDGYYSFNGGIPFGNFSRSIREDDDRFIIEDENGNEVDYETSLEKAKENVLGAYFDNQEYDEIDYKTDNDRENVIKKRKFISAINKLGIGVSDEQSAFTTSSEYIWIDTPSGDKMKIRFADHDNTHYTDISVQKDWKKAVRYVADVYNKWHEDYNDGETIRFSIGNVEQIASDNLDREFAEIGWDSRVKLSLATHEKRGRKTLEDFIDAQIEAGYYTEEEKKANLETLDKMAKLTKKLRKKYTSLDEWSDFENNFNTRGLKTKDDPEGREWFTILISNGDYERNIDFSTICKKRRALNRLLNLLIRKGVLTAEDFGEDGLLMSQIRKIIKDHGLEVACDLCFVDAKRYTMAKWGMETARLWNDIITELFGKNYKATLNFRSGNPDLTEVELTPKQQKIVDKYASMKMSTNEGLIGRVLKENPSLRKRLDANDFLASDGIDNIRKYAGNLYTYVNNRGGQASPKKSFLDIASDSQIIFAKILGGNDPEEVNKLLEKIYKEAGVRIQSFTDFIPYLFFDYVQVVSELSAKNMPMHSYTKELDFARLFGLTGIKINLSIVPKGLGYKQSKKLLKDENGNVVKDEDGNPIYEVALDKNGNPIYTVAKESIDLDEAFALRNKDGYDKSVGSIAIGVNDYQIEIMLNDERIDMIIPYHSSGLNGEAKHYMNITGFKDYTNVQTDKYIKTGGKVTPSMKFDFYGDLAITKDPRKTTNNYLEYCKKHGIRPRFEKFSKHKNYYKLLTDFKLFDKGGNYAPQQAIKPVYPEDFEKILKKSLDAYSELMGDYYKNLPLIVKQLEEEGLIANQELSRDLENNLKVVEDKNKISIREDMLTGWRGISDTDMPFSIKSDPKGTIKRIKAKQIAKEVVENMSKNQSNRKDSSPMFNDDYTQKLMGELRKELPVVMSDEDIEDIIDNAEVIAYKMWAKSKAKNQPIRFDEETANDYARHQIMDEIIRSEMREFAKNFKLEQREKELEKKAEASRLNKKLREQKGYSVKEIEADGIDIVRAFSEGEDSALKMVNKIVEKVSKANDDYDVYLANLIPTMSNVFEYAIEQLVYGRSRETALRRLLDLPKSNSVESLIKKSTELAQRMSKYYEKQIADQLEEQLDKQVGKQIDRIKKYAKQQILKVTKEKLPEIRTPELKRKIPALLQLHYNMIQKAVKMPSNARDERMEYLRNRKSKLEEGGLDLNYREAEELAVLSKYAGLEDMTPAQLMDILADLKAIKNGAKDELFMKKAEWEESIEEMAKPLVKNLSQHKNKVNESEGLIKQTLKGLTMLKQRLEMLFAKNRSSEVDAWIDRTVSNISRASIRERNFIGKEQEWLNKTIKECYKSMFDNRFGLVNTEMQAVSRLCKPNPKFAKYSKTGDYNLSIGQLMMIVSGLEQTNVKMWYEQAKERLERLESKEELSDIDEVKLKNLREQIAPWEKAYNNYDAMKNELTSEDLDFLMEIKKRFTERADLINDPLVRHSGLPLLTVGLNYMPIVREGEYSIMVHGASKPELIPAVYSARTLSPLYFDETANVLGVFHSRTKTDAHFINFSDIQWEMSSLFANKEMGNAIKTRVKKETRNQLERVITDVLRGSTYVEETPNSKMAGKISTVGAFAGMAFNIISAVKQPTSFPAFALETGAGRYLKGWASLMGSGRTLEFMNDLWKSEELKFRRGEGINLILSYLASEERQAKGDQNSLLKIMRRLYSVWGFKPMQLADTFGFLGATGVYWERYLGYRDTHDEQTAKKLAMEDVVAIGEMTQQSGLIHNLSEDQRKSGGFGRLFTLFRSTNQQWLSYEISAINDAMENPKSVEAWKKVGRVMFLNHFLLPLFFNGFGVLIDLLLGGALWDDEDERNEFIAQFFISGAMDVFCGWWFGSIMKGFVMSLAFGDRFDAPSLVVPASTTWERLFSAVFNACEELREGNWEGMWEEVNKMAKTVVPIYRTGERVYERITDDKERTFWW